MCCASPLPPPGARPSSVRDGQVFASGCVVGRFLVRAQTLSLQERAFPGGRTATLTLEANPSHLETVNAVTLGRTRAKQFYSGNKEELRARLGAHTLPRERVLPDSGICWQAGPWRPPGSPDHDLQRIVDRDAQSRLLTTPQARPPTLTPGQPLVEPPQARPPPGRLRGPSSPPEPCPMPQVACRPAPRPNTLLADCRGCPGGPILNHIAHGSPRVAPAGLRRARNAS